MNINEVVYVPEGNMLKVYRKLVVDNGLTLAGKTILISLEDRDVQVKDEPCIVTDKSGTFLNTHWTHLKTGNKYTVLYTAIDANNRSYHHNLDLDINVIYRNANGDLFSRNLMEFLEKFSPIYASNEPALTTSETP